MTRKIYVQASEVVKVLSQTPKIHCSTILRSWLTDNFYQNRKLLGILRVLSHSSYQKPKEKCIISKHVMAITFVDGINHNNIKLKKKKKTKTWR